MPGTLSTQPYKPADVIIGGPTSKGKVDIRLKNQGVDDVQLQAFFDSIQNDARPFNIYFKRTDLTLSNQLTVRRGNMKLQGEGDMASNWRMASSTAVDKIMLQLGANPVSNSTTISTITAQANRGEYTITIASADTSKYVVNDYMLVRSNKLSDAESASKKVGEIKQIKAINTGSGVITFYDPLYDTYLLSDTPTVVKLPMVDNLEFVGFGIQDDRASTTINKGIVTFQFVNKPVMKYAKAHDIYYGLEIISVLQPNISDVDIQDSRPTLDAPGGTATNLRYGIVVSSSTQGGVLSNITGRRNRHLITFGGKSGTVLEGIQRGVLVSNCVSEQSDTASFDTHQPCEGVVFDNCISIGGNPYAGNAGAYGFQTRGEGVSIQGGLVLNAIGRGVQVFGTTGSVKSHGTSIDGLRIRHVHQYNGANGIGIYLDSSGPDKVKIANNMIFGTAGRGISAGGGSDDLEIINNTITDCNAVSSGPAISLSNALRPEIKHNKIYNNNGVWLQTSGTSDYADIDDNKITNSNATYLDESASVVGSNNTIGVNRKFTV